MTILLTSAIRHANPIAQYMLIFGAPSGVANHRQRNANATDCAIVIRTPMQAVEIVRDRKSALLLKRGLNSRVDATL